eukprot:12401161-Karenia_brevis.AAC.1
MGPEAGLKQLEKVRLDFIKSSYLFSGSKMPASMCIPGYNVYSFSKCCYKLQLVDPDGELLLAEKRMQHSVLRLPYNTLCFDGAAFLDTVGLKPFRCMKDVALASKIRVYERAPH